MNDTVIDVRTPNEFASGHVDGAVNIPLERLMHGAEELENIQKDTPLIVYCRSGNRSGIAQRILNELGYKDVTNGINKEQVEASF